MSLQVGYCYGDLFFLPVMQISLYRQTLSSVSIAIISMLPPCQELIMSDRIRHLTHLKELLTLKPFGRMNNGHL